MAKTDARPGFSVLICPDSELLKERAESLLAEHPPASGEWERRVFWGDEEPTQVFWDALSQTSLFVSNRQVIVRQANLWKVDVWKNLSSALARPRENVWPFLCLEVGWEKGKFKIPAHIEKLKCMEFARKKGWLWERKGLEGAELEKFVAQEARRAKVSFEPEALRLFLENVIPDASAIRMEINKLAILNRGEKIVPETLSIDSGTYERDAFGTLKKIEAGNWRGVLEDINSGNQSNRLFFLLAVTERELRLFWQLLDGATPRMPKDEAPIKRKIASRLGKQGAARGFAIVANAEWQVKSGSRTPEQTLETFCYEITTLFASGG